MPEKPTWDQVADIAAKVDGAEPGMKGICLRGLPGWGEMFAPLTTRGEHLRRHLVREGLDAQGQRQAVHRRDQLLRQPGQGARRARSSTGRLHRVPQRDEPGQGRHVVRRHVGRRLARGPEGQQGRRQGRLRLRPGQGDRQLRLAVGLGLGDAEDDQEGRLCREVHALGLEQGLREPGRREAGLAPGPCRQARVDVREPRLHEGRRGLRRRRRCRRSSRPSPPTRVSSPGPRSACSSSRSPSSRTSAPRCRRTSPRPSPVEGRSRRRWTRDSSSPRTCRRNTSNASAPGAGRCTTWRGPPRLRGTEHQHPAASPGGRHDRHAERRTHRSPSGAATGSPLPQGAVVTTGTPAAGADLHHHHHADPVPADARDLDAELEHPAAG